MDLFRRIEKRSPSPTLNLFWIILLLPVAGILYLLWQEKLPWMEGEWAGERAVRGRRGEPGSHRLRQDKVPVHKETVQEPQGRQGLDRPAPDPKRQKDTSKAQHPVNRSQQRQEELEVIEGIGTKTAGILRDAGIVTLTQLADTSVERLNEILHAAGFRLNPPDSWPQQARLAADGNWEGLEQLKGQLHAGRRNQE